ncbi:MAG TPA: hypothetical protein VFY67_14875, partial [Pyrinomonadaceae bacterium]|nr:hypothetical protein [Pyrinomonadaceae bacterium]
ASSGPLSETIKLVPQTLTWHRRDGGIVLLCTLLPFLPGSYDNLAVALSEMAHMFGVVGLLLVPVGLIWLAANRSSRLTQRRHVVWLATEID